MIAIAIRYALLASVAFVVACCSPSHTDARVRTSLNLLADVIDPAYSLAVDGCIARKDGVMREGEAGTRTATSTEDALAVIDARCKRVVAAFEEMRVQHARARELVANGHVDAAEVAIVNIRETWRELRKEATP